MIRGLGIDVCQVSRMEKLLGGNLGARTKERLFTASEQAYCERSRKWAERYAARFAAKEAFTKAIGGANGLAWVEVEVVSAEGPPAFRFAPKAQAVLDAQGVARVHLTLTHDAGVAVAVVVTETA